MLSRPLEEARWANPDSSRRVACGQEAEGGQGRTDGERDDVRATDRGIARAASDVERRHGFPAPQRTGSGPRRYRLRDVARVVAVRRASEDGIPIAEAVARAEHDQPPVEIPAQAFAALVEHAPLPVAALSGPEPLDVAYVNGALARLTGDELGPIAQMLSASACGPRLQALFAAEHEEVVCEHPRWDGGVGQVRSIAFRLPVQPGQRPLVGMVSVEAARERALAGEVAILRE